jgi:hypothetical protein
LRTISCTFWSPFFEPRLHGIQDLPDEWGRYPSAIHDPLLGHLPYIDGTRDLIYIHWDGLHLRGAVWDEQCTCVVTQNTIHEIFEYWIVAYAEPFRYVIQPGLRTTCERQNLEALIRCYLLVKGHADALKNWGHNMAPNDYISVLGRACRAVRNGVQEVSGLLQ